MTTDKRVRRGRRIIYVAIGLPLVLLNIMLLLGVLYLATPLLPMQAALDALESDNAVTVTDGNVVVLRPTEGNPTQGIVFYPGARVRPEGYGVVLRQLAEAGYVVAMTKMRFNVAMQSPNRAQNVLDDPAFADVEQWAIIGHSNGALAASRFVFENPDAFEGLVMWAEAPQDDLSDVDIPALAIYGTNDAIIILDRMVSSAAGNFPQNTEFVVIEGGNHAGFANYADHYIFPDGEATITRDAQQAQALDATLAFIETVFMAE